MIWKKQFSGSIIHATLWRSNLYFISTIEKYLNSKGRQIIGWDEILEGGLAPNATVQSWRGEQGGVKAAQLHHNVIMSPTGFLYLPHPQILNDDSLTAGGYLPIKKSI